MTSILNRLSSKRFI